MTDDAPQQTSRRQRGLGAGLSSLFSDGGLAESGQATAARAPVSADVDIDLIHRNPNQPRRTFNESELLSLVDSIRRHGILQPLLLRPSQEKAGHFEIIAGERRWRAAQAAGLRAVPAAVKSLDELAMLEAAVVENLQRVDLNPIDEAVAFKQLIERFGKTQAQVAEQVGKSRVHIANTVRLLALPEDVRAFVVDGTLSAGHARALLAVEDPVSLAAEVIAKNLSVRELERRINRDAGKSSATQPAGRSHGSAARHQNDDADLAALEADLTAASGLQVTVRHGSGTAGRLEIAYDTLEQLDDLCRRLSAGYSK